MAVLDVLVYEIPMPPYPGLLSHFTLKVDSAEDETILLWQTTYDNEYVPVEIELKICGETVKNHE